MHFLEKVLKWREWKKKLVLNVKTQLKLKDLCEGTTLLLRAHGGCLRYVETSSPSLDLLLPSSIFINFEAFDDNGEPKLILLG